MSRKRYSISYCSGATGYGWDAQADSIEEAIGIVKSVYGYTSEIWVWDDEKREHIYWKRVLTYQPEIDTINAEW